MENLQETLRLHQLWLSNDSDGVRADLQGADLRGVNLRGADLLGADLRAYGDMKYLKTMQFDTWAIGYTHDTLQIGCQTHPIDKWKRWNTEAGHKWVDSMDETALEWAKSNLDIVLEIIKVNPAWNTKG